MQMKWLPEELDQFREILIERQTGIQKMESQHESEVLGESSREKSGGISDVRLHPADSGSDVAEQETILKLAEHEMLELQEIEQALLRLEGGSFGLCEACGALIGYKRLLAKPESRYCLNCQGEAEAMQHRARKPHEADNPSNVLKA